MIDNQDHRAEAGYPRPQLRRDDWIDLNGVWDFDVDDADRGLADGWLADDHEFGRRITVPFPPESPASGIGDPSYHPVVWYRRTLDLAPPADGELIKLHFGAVDYAAAVYLDGELVGDHVGGMTPFSVDVTQQLRRPGPHRLTLRVHDNPLDVAQPRGKQDWRTETHGIFYHRTTGIWQQVWAERVGVDHVADVAWTTDLDAELITAEFDLASTDDLREASVTVRVRLSHDGELLADQTVTAARGERSLVRLHLPRLGMPMERERLLWSPERPRLIDAEITLTVDGTETDRLSSYLGLREVAIRDGQFLLNGKPYYSRLVLEQGYWPESHLTAPNPEALAEEVRLIKELGFNGARIHQKVEDPRFLYWCDRLGLLVWGEMANAFVYNEKAATRLTREWLDVVRRDRSHPSIVCWVPLNESWGVPGIPAQADQQHFATALYHLTKALDPTRPVISNDGWEHTESDIWSIHDYSPVPEDLTAKYGTPEALQASLTEKAPNRRRVLLGEREYRGQPIMITEFGGLSYAPSQGERWFGYATVTSAEEFLEHFASLVTAITDLPDVAGFCYTQLTDTVQETNGLLAEDRSAKLPIEELRKIITRPARSIPAEVVDGFRRRAAAASAGGTNGKAPAQEKGTGKSHVGHE
ncbi:glycoside hydrolase family 2 protein [Microlunatus sp. GCM10028923]|uniref:glycoside hydrolase family 2 protein n=1 Tax=Microlunatus sp. GCM10028923 TaxID=3273400 RepID=UPI0036111621